MALNIRSSILRAQSRDFNTSNECIRLVGVQPGLSNHSKIMKSVTSPNKLDQREPGINGRGKETKTNEEDKNLW